MTSRARLRPDVTNRGRTLAEGWPTTCFDEALATQSKSLGRMLRRGRTGAGNNPYPTHASGPAHDYTPGMSDIFQPSPELLDAPLMRAVRREPVPYTPVWIMRQAGRYLPEYMAVREKVTFLDLCEKPELAAQVTLDAQRILNTDAAILFADLLPILRPMGLHLTYEKGEGPKLHNPLREPSDLDRFRPLESVSELEFTLDAVRLIRKELPANIPLLGFAGAPFTLASYSIEGSGSKDYRIVKSWIWNHPTAFDQVMSIIADSVADYLIAQLHAGCQAVQLFDSWAGCLSVADYRRSVLPYSKHIIDKVRPHGPVIHFLTGNPALIPAQTEAGGDVMGVDWRCELADTWDMIGPEWAVQGNMDPILLCGDWEPVRQRATQILDSVAGRPGHIFNLGHGVLPQTIAQNVKDLVQLVHDHSTSV